MTETYGFRITDGPTGKRLGARVGLASAYIAGLAANQLIATLLGQGYRPGVLFLAYDGDRCRELTLAEKAAVVSALEQVVAQLTEEIAADEEIAGEESS